MKIKPSPIAAAVTMTLLSVAFAAQAQQADKAPAAKSEAAQLEQVVVTGIRASLQSATNIKRNSTAVVDAVSAEDVGKLPDSDVGESLGRLPGITVGRAFGQGASVSVRGSDPQMTYTTLNGQTVASTGWYDQATVDRSFNYSLLPSELIGGMEVYKSSQADLTEGGIGGTVIVKTRKPLDLKANTVFGSVKFGKGTVSTDLSKDVAGLYSWRNEGKTFGVLVAGARENSQYIRRGIESDAGWAGDVAPATFVQDRKRSAINLTLQAKPTDSIELGLNYLSLELTGDNTNSNLYLFTGQNDPNAEQPNAITNCVQKNAAGLCVKAEAGANNPVNTFIQTWARQGKMSSDSLVLNGAFKGDSFKLEAVAGETKAKGGTSHTMNYGVGWWDAGQSLPKFKGTIDATGKQISISPSVPMDVSVSNLPKQLAPTGWATDQQQPNSDKERFGQLDATFDFDWAGLTAFKTGLRTTSHKYAQSALRAKFNKDVTLGNASDLYSGGTIKMGPNGWDFPKANLSAMADLYVKNTASWTEQRSSFAEIEESNSAAYGMFEFEKAGWRGNFGLRYVKTDVSSRGYKFDGTPLAANDVPNNDGWGRSIDEQKASYSDWLPSLNAAYNIDKNLVLRIAAAKAITRPNFEYMFQAKQAGYNDDRAGNLSMTMGTVSLKPQSSKQFDLGLEYYYGRGNMVSAAVFHKTIDNFVTAQVQTGVDLKVYDPRFPADRWTVNNYLNAGGGKINGLEAQINHSLDNGFGFAASYTYADAKAPGTSYPDRLALFTQSSKHTANLVGFYENEVYSARVAYNWRSKYMIRETGYYSYRMHDPYGSLDVSAGWNINKNLRLSLEAVNLLKQDDVQYGAADASNTNVKGSMRAGYPAWSFMGETTYRVGLSAKF
ncbi:iron complex outermembrane receptor protein [Paucibacter oligotrophus]|uniref:Iron complex outermembrane receptor protein n=1 Tax=Roseateles oligotrophus TaxID=1769250 RepID=A0A840L8A9_9BURK|nr:TonB-dependent receptor [Roseateles oligotrophus]MBB4843003.1 iron complex outermembrane receptor protein [Roseateles oligotrophus]